MLYIDDAVYINTI